MNVFAIDPGPEKSAFVTWDGSKITRMGHVENDRLLGILGVQANFGCVFVCERIASYGMAVGKEVFETCFWTGRFIERVNGCLALVERLKVKMHLCHDSRAKDSNIRRALIDRLGAPGTKKNPGVTYGVHKDIWAALALAVTFHDQNAR